jgi:hypothetical protein
MMRASYPLALLIATLLSACASDKDALASKHLAQQGALKVHPGLLGEPAPPEMQPNAQPANVGAQPTPVAAPIAVPAVEAPPPETSQVKQGE